MKDSMNVIDTRLPELLRGSRPLLGMFVGMPVPGLVEMCGHMILTVDCRWRFLAP